MFRFKRNQKLMHEVCVETEEELRVLKIILELLNIEFTTETVNELGWISVKFYVKRKYSRAVIQKIKENVDIFAISHEV